MEASRKKFAEGGGGFSLARSRLVRCRSGKGHDSLKVCVLAVFAVIIMLLTAITPTASEGADTSSNSWECTIKIYKTTIETKYSQNGEPLEPTTSVKGFSVTATGEKATDGSWGFDDDGYGPFGSFYVAFDASTGVAACHLDPEDLSKTITGEPIDTSQYNIMWVLPTVWMEVTDVIYENKKAVGSTLVMSSEKKSENMTAPGHTIDSVVYNYLALEDSTHSLML